jgi:hypothetical protein
VSIRDALELLGYAALVLLYGTAAWTLAAHRRRFGSAFAWARPYRRSVRVPVDGERAHELCDRALLEVLRSRTAKRDRRGEITARVGSRRRSHLHSLRFRLRPDAPDTTLISIESTSTGNLGPGAAASRRDGRSPQSGRRARRLARPHGTAADPDSRAARLVVERGARDQTAQSTRPASIATAAQAAIAASQPH